MGCGGLWSVSPSTRSLCGMVSLPPLAIVLGLRGELVREKGRGCQHCDNPQVSLRFAVPLLVVWPVLQGLLEKINSSEGWDSFSSNQDEITCYGSAGLGGVLSPVCGRWPVYLSPPAVGPSRQSLPGFAVSCSPVCPKAPAPNQSIQTTLWNLKK